MRARVFISVCAAVIAACGGDSDGGASDSGASDSGASDGGASDSGASEGGVSDGGAPDSGVIGDPIHARVMLGPIEGALVRVYEYPDLINAVATATTGGGAFENIGRFTFPSELVDPARLYVLSASGGSDHDVDEDGIEDAAPTANRGRIQAIVEGRTLIDRSGAIHVSALTDAAYRSVWYRLAVRDGATSIRKDLDRAARIALTASIDGDGDLDRDDLAIWNPATDRAALYRSLSGIAAELRSGKAPFGSSARALDPLLAVLPGRGCCALFSDGARVYAGSQDGVSIYDASGLNVLGAIDGAVSSIAATGTIAVTIDAGGALRKIDVSDPANPIEIDTLSFGPGSYSVTSTGGFAYVARGVDGLAIVDLVAWTILGELAGEARALAVRGSIAYVAAGQSGLRVVDVADPRAPMEVASLPSRERTEHLLLAGDTLYTAERFEGVRSIDVRDPLQPRELAFADPIGAPRGLALIDGALYFSDGVWVQQLDATDLRPLAIDRFLFGSQMISARGLLWIALREEGLRVLRPEFFARNPLEATTRFSFQRTIADLAADGALAAVSKDDFELAVIEGSTIASTVRIPGAYPFPGFPAKIELANDFAFVAADGAISRVDLRAPLIPQTVSGTIATGVTSFHAEGDRLYVARYNRPSTIFDIADPTITTTVSTFVASSELLQLKPGDGGKLYAAAGYDGLIIFDASNPAAIVEEGRLATEPYTRELAVDSAANIVYLAGSSTITAVDVRDPARPRALGRYRVPGFGAADLQLRDGLLYLNNGVGLRVLELSDPTNLAEIFRTEFINGMVKIDLGAAHVFEALSSPTEVMRTPLPVQFPPR